MAICIRDTDDRYDEMNTQAETIGGRSNNDSGSFPPSLSIVATFANGCDGELRNEIAISGHFLLFGSKIWIFRLTVDRTILFSVITLITYRNRPWVAQAPQPIPRARRYLSWCSSSYEYGWSIAITSELMVTLFASRYNASIIHFPSNFCELHHIPHAATRYCEPGSSNISRE